MEDKLKGTGVALVTPFQEDKSIDFESLEKIIEHVISGGVDYLVSLGTTGETPTLSTDEKLEILQFTIKTSAGRLPVVAGVGGNNTAEVIKNLEKFQIDGVDAILSVSPYYNKPTQEGIYQHYMAIDKAAVLPVIIYNVPARTGSNITASTTLRLANGAEHMIAVKEASGSMEQCMEIIQKKPDNFLVISGEDALTLPFISVGMSGVISVVANAVPSEFSNMVTHALAGELSKANPLHYNLLPLIDQIFADGSPGGIKYALSELGLCQNVLRLPLVPVGANTSAKLKDLMQMFEEKV